MRCWCSGLWLLWWWWWRIPIVGSDPIEDDIFALRSRSPKYEGLARPRRLALPPRMPRICLCCETSSSRGGSFPFCQVAPRAQLRPLRGRLGRAVDLWHSMRDIFSRSSAVRDGNFSSGDVSILSFSGRSRWGITLSGFFTVKS